jgi:hypothetical protein
MPVERTVLVRLKADVSAWNRGLAEAAVGVNALRKEINTTNDRTAWLTQGILALAPAVVPLGAAAVPVFTGIATQMTVGAIAAGTMALGFHGIGDALKALNTYQLEPTAANLQKLHDAMHDLSGEGQEFVRFIDSLSPLFGRLSGTAQAGMLPGIQSGIEHLITLAPKVQRIVDEIAHGIGQLADEAGQELAGPKFEQFFNFLQTQAEPILIEMGHTVGHLAAGLAALFVDFLPESEKFSTGLEHIAERFDQWAQELDQTEGFQKFLAYIDKAGPETLSFLGALFDALVAITDAAAPVGNVMLPAFTDLLKVIAQVASTPFGSTLIALGAAMSVYGRAVAIGSNLTGGLDRGLGLANAQAIKTAFGFRTLTRDVTTYVSVARSAGTATTEMNEKQATALVGIKKWGTSAARVGGQAALLGVAASGVADKFHLGNTAALAMAGSLAGPWGAAIGGGVGLVLDFASAQHHAAVDTEDLAQSINAQTGAVTANSREIAYNKLLTAGAFDLAGQLGVQASVVQKAFLGNAAALAQLNTQLGVYFGQTAKGFYSASGQMPTFQPEQVAAAQKLMTIVQAGVGAINQRRAAILAEQQVLGRTNATTLKAANAQRDLTAQVKAARQAAVASTAQWDILGKHVNDAKVSLHDWVTEMDRTAAAMEHFGENALRAAHKGLDQGLIKSLEAAGPAGALRMKQLADASQTEIGRANQAWARFTGATDDATRALTQATKPFRLNVDIGGALQNVRTLQYAVDHLHGNTVILRTTGGHATYDTGGFTGWGPKYDVRGVVHAGEVVIPQDLVIRDWAYLKSRYGYLPGFSEGGLVGMSVGASVPATAGPVSIDTGPLQITGTLRTPWGPAQVEGIAERTARTVYRAESTADRDFDRARAGA